MSFSKRSYNALWRIEEFEIMNHVDTDN